MRKRAEMVDTVFPEGINCRSERKGVVKQVLRLPVCINALSIDTCSMAVCMLDP